MLPLIAAIQMKSVAKNSKTVAMIIKQMLGVMIQKERCLRRISNLPAKSIPKLAVINYYCIPVYRDTFFLI
jgi:hypothetical protein